MKSVELTAIATIMIAFSTFLGVLFAGAYYLLSVGRITFLGAIVYAIIYIDINLLFLYMLKRGKIFNE